MAWQITMWASVALLVGLLMLVDRMLGGHLTLIWFTGVLVLFIVFALSAYEVFTS